MALRLRCSSSGGDLGDEVLGNRGLGLAREQRFLRRLDLAAIRALFAVHLGKRHRMLARIVSALVVGVTDQCDRHIYRLLLGCGVHMYV